MGEFNVKKSDFKTPPEDSYFLDLIWIEQVEGPNGPYYRWHWGFADVPAQKEWAQAGCRASSITPIVPTLQNRFGSFIKTLKGNLEEGMKGSTEELAMDRYRVKAFIEHNKKDAGTSEERVYCSVKKLIEGSAKKGEGIGHKGAWDGIKDVINVYLAKAGMPLLVKEENEEGAQPRKEAGASNAESKPTGSGSAKKKDVAW
jgi:hypothetical protein